MGGQIVLSSSGEETRQRWWHSLQNDGWMLALPTRGQATLSAERAAPFFSQTLWLEQVATIVALGRSLTDRVCEEEELVTALGDAGAQQVLAWQRAGLITSKQAGALPSAGATGDLLSRWAALEGPNGLPTPPWCAAHVAGDKATDGLPMPKVYLENVYGPSPVELRLMQKLSEASDVLLRVRDVWGAAWIERSYAPMLETLGKAGNWQGVEDQAPDAADRAKLASALFPTEREGAKKLTGGETVHHRVFASVEEELRALAERLPRVLLAGVAAADVVVALPDSPSYRQHARAILSSSGAPLAFIADASPGEGIAVLAHRDLGARQNRALFVAGADGAPDALLPGGGWTVSDPALLPPILLDAFESRQGEVYLSSVGSERRYTDSVARAFGGLTSW